MRDIQTQLHSTIRDLTITQSDAIEAWLMNYFGSYEVARQVGHYYVLEYSEPTYECLDHGIRSEQTVTIRRKTQQELNDESNSA